MLSSAVSGEKTQRAASPQRELFLKAFRFMLMARAVEEKFASLYRAGKIAGGVYIGRGQEALSVALGISLRKGDIYAPLIRDAAGRLAFGEPLLDGVRTYLGSALGPARGRDGNIHRGRPREGLLAMVSHLGGMISVVNGALLARRFKGATCPVGGACLGDGGTSTGAFHEALNQAAIEKLPLVLVIANNQYAYSTPTSRQFACRTLVDKAVGYGVAGHAVDGTDLGACLETIGDAVQRAREGAGPQLIIGRLLRLSGHGEHDDAHYVDPKLKASPLGRDCLKVAEEFLLSENWMDATAVQVWRTELHDQIEDAVARVQREPAPDPFQEQWLALASTHLGERREMWP